jgi:hypothetical protein
LVEQYARQIQWPHGALRIIAHERNLGLRAHVLSCGDLVKDYDAIVMLEDDIYVAPDFYNYAQQAVTEFCDSTEVAGISLYAFRKINPTNLRFNPLQNGSDCYLVQKAQSWGQVWMKRQWQEFRAWYANHCEEFTEQPHLPKFLCSWPKSSWLKYHIKYCIEQHKYFVYPNAALATCFADAGTHIKTSSAVMQSSLMYGTKEHYNFKDMLKYDAYFEPEIIHELLKMSPEELCIDFHGLKGNREHRRYWLTRERMNYKIIKAYALQMHPYVNNIIHNVEGCELFLYDTTQPFNNQFDITARQQRVAFGSYMFGIRTDLAASIFHTLQRWKHRLKH